MDSQLKSHQRLMKFDNEAFDKYLVDLTRAGIIKRFDIMLEEGELETNDPRWPWFGGSADEAIVYIGDHLDFVTVLDVIKLEKEADADLKNRSFTVCFTMPYLLSWDQQQRLLHFFGSRRPHSCYYRDVHDLRIWRMWWDS